MSVLNKNDKYIIYKGHKLSKKQVFNNLKKLLELAESDDYSYWYKDAFKYASGIFSPRCQSLFLSPPTTG